MHTPNAAIRPGEHCPVSTRPIYCGSQHLKSEPHPRCGYGVCSSVAECQRKCCGTKWCTGFDFRNGEGCTLYEGGVLEQRPSWDSRAGVDHYTLTRAIYTCVDFKAGTSAADVSCCGMNPGEEDNSSHVSKLQVAQQFIPTFQYTSSGDLQGGRPPVWRQSRSE
jgi:hypothetical protein